MDYIKLTEEVLSVEEVTSLATHPSCGAISLFIGTTRDNFQGKDVVQLSYEAYQEMAYKEMHKLCAEVREKWDLKHIALHHRLGCVPVTESSVIVAVSSEHRHESLEAVTFLIDSLKAKVPIWKKEIYRDGGSDWKRNKECVWGAKENGLDSSGDKRPFLEDGNDRRKSPTKKIKDDADFASEVKEEKRTNEGNNEQDSDVVQIIASKNEINRRIAAFQQCRREELDVLNIQEFCTLSEETSSQNSCARTSAVVSRSKGSSSHLKLTHVVNDWGPQTLGMDPGSVSTNQAKEMLKKEPNISRSTKTECLNPSVQSYKESPGHNHCKEDKVCFSENTKQTLGIEERLHNLECHLKIVHGAPVPQDVYARLKAIEDRVLHLEGISPEYFKIDMTSTRKARRLKEIKAVEDDISLDELDVKIHEVKMKLKRKQLK